MRTLLIDNYDSYTYNLFQLIAEVSGAEPVTVLNDDPLLTRLPSAEFQDIVISPGPGRPQSRRDLGHIPELLRDTTLPVLGVCLGHQAIAHLSGAAVRPAPRARHGHLSRIKHDDGAGLFAGIPEEFLAVRYHSLCVEEPLPPHLKAIAWADDGVIMAMRHLTLPRWGVQFHPESIATEYGHALLANFRRLNGHTTARPTRRKAPATTRVTPGRWELLHRKVAGPVDTEAAFMALYRDSSCCYWLDSSHVEPGLARFSFLGDASGPLSEILTYRAGSNAVEVSTGTGNFTESGDVFDVLNRRLAARAIADPGLPFGFDGGYVGYFGYEVKADCGARPGRQAPTPDSLWIFADRLIAVDHETGEAHLVAVHDGRTRAEAAAWIERTEALLSSLPATPPEIAAGPTGLDPEPYLTQDWPAYRAGIEECLRQLHLGESYEICLTNRVHIPFTGDDVAYYRRLRRVNPAPYAAFFRAGGVSVLSSSPEQFLHIDRDGVVQSKPIKGTARRDADPVRDAELAKSLATDPKTQAENLMIVDLLRNDLGRVCSVGSVSVPSYLAVESYATVHQLVSTIRGRLRPDVSPVDCVRACFPGGSMTGAPKLRTMEIIDELEPEARGVYSGALGYFGLSGQAVLSIVIRTAVLTDGELTVGAGGAIVLDSDPRAEFEEMLLKAATPLRAWTGVEAHADV